jgi:methyl-accepting chemotaxis protein
MSEIAIILKQQQEASFEISRSIEGVAETATGNNTLLAAMSHKLAESNDTFSERAKGWHQEGDPRSLCEVAKIDHVLFKKRVVDTVMARDSWRSCDMPDHHHCRLGKWYDSVSDQRIRRLPAFACLVEPHERVHRLGQQVLGAIESNDRSRAIAMLQDLSDASGNVVSMLDDLSHAIEADDQISAA